MGWSAQERDKIELPQVYRHCTARAGIDVKTHLLEEFKELGLVKFNTCKRIKHGSHIGNLSGKKVEREKKRGKRRKRKRKRRNASVLVDNTVADVGHQIRSITATTAY